MTLTPLILPLSRGIALFFGAFAGLNLIGGRLANGFDANLWWIDLRAVPGPVAAVVIGGGAALLLAFAFAPAMGAWRKRVTIAILGLLIVTAVVNTITVWALHGRGAIDAGFAAPFSLMVAGALGVVLIGAARAAVPSGGWLTRGSVVGAAVACAGAFAVGQMFCFGMTDYRRGADVAVVFGCLAYADGRPSLPLADRVRTAVGLYEQGHVRTLVFSGGPGAGDVHETESMRLYAMRLGVPDEAIVLDREGLSTQHTVANTAGTLRGRRVITVSNFYHLPRIKLAYQRAGVDVLTVPADDTRTMTQLPYNMMREVAALWVYYLRPLAG